MIQIGSDSDGEEVKAGLKREYSEINRYDICSDSKTLLNILLMEPEQYELKSKPRSDLFCMLNSENISIESCKADDNGTCYAARVTKKFYKVEFENNRITDITGCHSANNS